MPERRLPKTRSAGNTIDDCRDVPDYLPGIDDLLAGPQRTRGRSLVGRCPRHVIGGMTIRTTDDEG